MFLGTYTPEVSRAGLLTDVVAAGISPAVGPRLWQKIGMERWVERTSAASHGMF